MRSVGLNWRILGRQSLLLWSATALLVLACGSGVDPAGVVISDSAGVVIVESRSPAWSPEQRRLVATVPVVDIGADQSRSEQTIGVVGSVVRLSDGTIVVADGGESRLAFFDSAGGYLRSVGRRGQGPGEFMGMWGTFRCAADTLIVDQAVWIGVFEPDGRFVKKDQIFGPAGAYRGGVHGVSDHCSSLLLLDRQRAEPRSGRFTDTRALYWWKRGTTQRDTLVSFPGPDLGRIMIGGRPTGARLPFGRNPVWAVSHNLVYFSSSETAEIKIFDRTGALRRIVRWAASPQEVDAEDRAIYARRRSRYLRRHPGEAVVYRPLGDYPVPPAKPVLAGIVVDDSGGIWVRQYPKAVGGKSVIVNLSPDDPAESWWVFAADGRWLGSVEMPPGFLVYSIGPDRVFGLYVDSTFAEHVRAYEITASD